MKFHPYTIILQQRREPYFTNRLIFAFIPEKPYILITFYPLMNLGGFSTLAEEVASCKSLIVAQTAMTTQMQSEITALKLEAITLRSSRAASLSAQENRRYSFGVKSGPKVDNTDTDKSASESALSSLTDENRRRCLSYSMFTPSTSSKTQKPIDVSSNEENVGDKNPVTDPMKLTASISNLRRKLKKNTSDSAPVNLKPSRGRKCLSKNTTSMTGSTAKLVLVEKFCFIYVSNLSSEQKTDDIMDVLKEIVYC